MGAVTQLSAVQEHEGLVGVRIFPLTDGAQKGVPQEVLVDVSPGGLIPLHSHEVDATMIIVGGAGTVLSDDPQINGRSVEKCDVVFFEKRVMHGFRASDRGLLFISRNGGIVDEKPEQWDITFKA